MEVHVFKFPKPEERTVYYYGGVKMYDGATVTYKRCPIERKNRLQAVADSKKLLVKLRKDGNVSTRGFIPQTN